MAATGQRSVRRRPFGVRLYLALAFGAVALITAVIAYLVVGDTGNQQVEPQLTDIAVGRTAGLAEAIGDRPPQQTEATLSGVNEEGYSAWVFDREGGRRSPSTA